MTRAEWARRKGRSSSFISRSICFAIYARDRFDCIYCRQVFPPDYSGAGLCLDHVVPRSGGGDNSPGNLVTSCMACNSSKQSRIGTLTGWYGCTPEAERRIKRQLKKPLNRELGRWLARQASELRARYRALE